MKEKETYTKKAQQSIDDVLERINNLEKKAKKATGEQKENLEKRIETLKEHRDNLQKKFNTLKKATKESWAEAKRGFEEAREALGSAWERVKVKFE